MEEFHPYGMFIPANPEAMIIGSFPIGKFTNPKRKKEIKSHEIDFFFGGEKNLLWKLLGAVFERELKTKEEIIKLLEERRIAIGDVVASCKRREGRASDSDLYDIKWNYELIKVIEKYQIRRIYFTSKRVQKWFRTLFPDNQFEEILLISPSAQSARGLGRNPSYKLWKKLHPEGKAWDFILVNYKRNLNN